MALTTKAVFLFFLVCSITSCGRKQRTIFQFSEKESVKINKLALPVIRGISIIKKTNGILITWQPVDTTELNKSFPNISQHLGYNVYRLVKGYFVPKFPINPKLITNTEYLDTKGIKQKDTHSYMVRGVFSIDGRVIQGPSSQILGTSS